MTCAAAALDLITARPVTPQREERECQSEHRRDNQDERQLPSQRDGKRIELPIHASSGSSFGERNTRLSGVNSSGHLSLGRALSFYVSKSALAIAFL